MIIGIIDIHTCLSVTPPRGMGCMWIGCCRNLDKFEQRCESPLSFTVIVCYNKRQR